MKSKMVNHGFPSFDESIAQTAFAQLLQGAFSGRHLMQVAGERLARFAGVDFAIPVNSGFSALQGALVAGGVRAGQRVLLPDLICPSVYHAVLSIGAKPLITDVGRDTPLIVSPDQWEASNATDKPDHVIVSHMFGLVADAKAWLDAGFPVIEDVARTMKKEMDQRSMAMIFSFSPTKLLTVGYGGALLTNHAEVARQASHFFDAAMDHDRHEPADLPFRIHGRLSDFQSTMLIAQMDRYEKVIQARTLRTQMYDRLFGNPNRLKPLIPFRYQLILEKPNAIEMAERIKRNGVIVHPLGSHRLSKTLGIAGSFLQATYWENHVLSLPLHDGLSEEDILRVADEVRHVL